MFYVDIKSEIFDWSWLDRVPATDAIFMLTIWQGVFALDKTGFRETTSLAICERFRQQVVMGVPVADISAGAATLQHPTLLLLHVQELLISRDPSHVVFCSAMDISAETAQGASGLGFWSGDHRA
jgi:hypothetical protein